MKYIALLLALILSGCTVLASSETPAAGKTTTARVTRGDLILGLSADGSITLPVTGLDFAVSGIIKNIFVSPGDMVSKGDLLAELDDADLLLALKTAQNNLEKAQLSYEEAVANAAYTLRSETMNLESTRQKLNTAFDDYTYQQNIENRALQLERSQQDYANKVLSATQSEDEARLYLSRQEEKLAEELAAYDKLEKEDEEAFDDFAMRNTINTAQINLDRAKRNLDEAKKDLSQLRRTYNDAQSAYDIAYRNFNSTMRAYEELIVYYISVGNTDEAEKVAKQLEREQPNDNAVKIARDALDAKENAIYNAQNTYDDAERSLNHARETLNRDSDSYTEDQAERKENALEAAQKTVTLAQQSVDDARTSLEKILIRNEQDILSGKQNMDDAEVSFTNAQTELIRGHDKYREDQRDIQNTYALQNLKIENLTQSDLTIKNALFNIEDARNKLESAENDLAKVRITAPIDGVVLNVTKRIGEKVSENESAPGFFMGSSSTNNSLITIRDMSQIYLTANIPEGDIVGLALGQPIRMEVDALGDEILYATVYSISSIPNQDSSGIVTYEVVGILDTLNENIRDRMSVFMTFIKREITNVLLIPNRAVFMEDGQQYVHVQHDDGSLEKRAVVCGFSNGSQTEVKHGLELGETVIAGRINP